VPCAGLPGFGLSPHPKNYGYTPAEHAAVVTEFVRGLGLENLTVMGQDWGGPIGMRVALNEPDRIRALVMGNTWYWQTTGVLRQGFGMLMSTDLMQGQIYRKNLFVEKLLTMGVKHEVPEIVHDHYRGPFPTIDSRTGIAEFPRQLNESAEWLTRIAGEVPEVLGSRPLLLTWGMDDPIFPPSLMDRFREDFTDVQVTRLDAKHFIQEDAPSEIAAAIEGFLGR